MSLTVYNLGFLEYPTAMSFQDRIVASRIADTFNDTLLILEHPPTVTIGSSGSTDNILVPRETLIGNGIQVYCTDRGGDVTYHGPGQLVCYPVFDLAVRGRDLHRYVYDLEQVIIRTVSDFGVEANRGGDHRGVWSGVKQIASIGIRVKKWVSMHGFSLNVDLDLFPYSFINPCGLAGRRVTSISKEAGRHIRTDEVAERVVRYFEIVFDTESHALTASLDWSNNCGKASTLVQAKSRR